MKLLVANLKMNLLKEETTAYLEIASHLNSQKTKLVVCPSLLYLGSNPKYNDILGCQNIFYEEKGAYTGEISVKQVKDIGINYLLINHSERTLYGDETSYKVNKKLALANKYNLKVILCIGDSLEDKHNNNSLTSIVSNLKTILKDINNINNLVIAYEPLYAIGTGLVPSCEEINIIIKGIKEYIKEVFNQNIMVIYGGSVDNHNIFDIMSKDCDGFIVGSYILDTQNLIEMYNIIDNL